MLSYLCKKLISTLGIIHVDFAPISKNLKGKINLGERRAKNSC